MAKIGMTFCGIEGSCMVVRNPEIVPLPSLRSKTLEEQFVAFHDIKPCLNANHLVAGWLGEGGLSVLFGASNSGKTFNILDMAVHVASGVEWRGHKVKAGPVIYVAAEGGAGIQNRLSAIRKAKPELNACKGFYLLPTSLDLHGVDDATALCLAIPCAQAALIVIDTMARSMGGGDENSARDVSQFVRNLDAIRASTGAHVLVVHHSGKNVNAGARGSSALRAAVDTEIVIADKRIFCTKQRDMEEPQHVFFDLETVALGFDQDGDIVTSAVVISADCSAITKKRPTGRDEVAERSLTEALRLHGSPRNGDEFPKGSAVVHNLEWREQCDKNGLTKVDARLDTKRKAFERAKNRLLSLNSIGICGDYVWKIQNDD
eukprot:GHVU01101453.1.p1 GENE.GHVU01101453.1~~GHVU01101453.1.p1  ORF type:complete len:375 (+),score=27.24 GHVU01101453.1:26-1150(+)